MLSVNDDSPPQDKVYDAHITVDGYADHHVKLVAGLQHVSSFAIVLTGISCAVLATTLGLDAHGDPRMRCMIQTALRLLAISFSLSFGALCSCYGIFAYAAFTTGPKLHTLRRLAMVISQGTILLGVVTFCGGFGLLIYVCDATR